MNDSGANGSKFDFNRNRGIILVGAILAILALGNDVAGAVSGLYSWAQTSQGQAMLLVGVVLVVLFLALDRFVSKF